MGILLEFIAVGGIEVASRVRADSSVDLSDEGNLRSRNRALGTKESIVKQIEFGQNVVKG
jgi:hypothetical protein